MSRSWSGTFVWWLVILASIALMLAAIAHGPSRSLQVWAQQPATRGDVYYAALLLWVLLFRVKGKP